MDLVVLALNNEIYIPIVWEKFSSRQETQPYCAPCKYLETDSRSLAMLRHRATVFCEAAASNPGEADSRRCSRVIKESD